MDSYVKAITLDVNADENYTIIKAKQGDKINRKIAITLKKDGANFTPTGVSQIWFRVQKPDKNIAIVKSTDSGNPISSAGNVYTVTLSEQCLTASGKAWCDLAFLDSSGNTLSSCAFILNIIPMPNGNTARSISEWTDLQQAIDDAERFASIVAFRTSGNYIQYTVDGTTWVNLTTVGAIGGDLQTQINALNGAVNEETAERKTYTKPNLLDNWCFVGGGSQAGATKLPINQRGLSSYSTLDSIAIDRWVLRQGTLTFPNTNNCIKFTRIEQHIDDGLFDVVIGKKVTFSILTAGGNLYSYTATASSGNWMATTPTGYSFVGWGHTVQITDSNAVGVVAVKLELGDTQTLAHQVNGAWVLNEIPDFGEQMARCRRYYQVINGNMFAGVNSNGDGYDVSVPVDVLMRAVPTATGSTLASVYIDGTQYSGTFAWTRVLETNANTSTVYTLRFSYSGGTLPAMKIGRCYLYGILSAEI